MELKAFVSYSKSVETGLDGTIGMAFSKYNPNENFMSQLAKATSATPLTNYQFYFTQTNQNENDLYPLYNGTLIFSAAPVKSYQDNFFQAGEADVDEQIYNMGMSDLQNVASDIVINPFLKFELANLTFGLPKVQSSQVFYSKFSGTTYLTSMTQGIHLPNAIYEYMNSNFFQWICYDVNNLDSQSTYFFEKTSSYLPLEECECKG